MILRDNEIVLRSAKTIRSDWEASFEKMTEQGDDALLDVDEIEWAW